MSEFKHFSMHEDCEDCLGGMTPRILLILMESDSTLNFVATSIN